MAKQRALRTVDSLNDSNQDAGSVAGRGSRWRSLPRGGGSRGANELSSDNMRYSSNNLMPRGQYKIMQDN